MKLRRNVELSMKSFSSALKGFSAASAASVKRGTTGNNIGINAIKDILQESA